MPQVPVKSHPIKVLWVFISAVVFPVPPALLAWPDVWVSQ